MTNLILAAVAALAVGLIIGLLIGRSSQGTTLRQRRTEQQMEELRNEYTRYQAQVNEHFMESAHLLRRFNDAFRDVNHHMARGANRLANDDEWLDELEQEKQRARLTGAKTGDSDVAEPPRDYAPKKDPDEKGTLDEGYGLTDEEKAKA
ncbi:YhcB family protein [Marinobacter sp. OP 3.4]|uniref:YhcB family protein n=1 Tax=Marinobacter sp. OP 3.4 TaxID=3076501 RepID=UPI002E1C1A59